MSTIDLKPVPKEQREADLQELIKEARSKIRPILQVMPPEEVKSYLMTLEDAEGHKHITVKKHYFDSLLAKHGINYEELRKIQDKHYEVDIEYELTRDLFEKQRIVDNYLQEHQEDNQLLNQYYQNTYARHTNNKHEHTVYTLPYEPRQIRLNIRTMCFTTALAGACMFMAHPYLPLLLAYDVFLIGKSM